MNKKNIEGFAGLDSWPKCRKCEDVKDLYESGFNIAKSIEADCTKYLNLAEQLYNDKIVDNNKRFIEVDNNIKFNNDFVLKIDSKLFDSIISYNKEVHDITISTFDKDYKFLEDTPIRISTNSNGFRTTIFKDKPPRWDEVKYISSKYDKDYSYNGYISKRNSLSNKISSTIAMKINHQNFIENEYEKKVTFFRNSIFTSKKIIENLKKEIKINNDDMKKSNDEFVIAFNKITTTSIKLYNNINNLKPINQDLRNQIKILVDKNNIISINIKKKMNEIEKLRLININYTIGDTINDFDQNNDKPTAENDNFLTKIMKNVIEGFGDNGRADRYCKRRGYSNWTTRYKKCKRNYSDANAAQKLEKAQGVGARGLANLIAYNNPNIDKCNKSDNGHEFYCKNRFTACKDVGIDKGDYVNNGYCNYSCHLAGNQLGKPNIQLKNPFVKVNETNEIKDARLEKMKMCVPYRGIIPNGTKDQFCKENNIGILEKFNYNKDVYKTICEQYGRNKTLKNNIVNICKNCNNLSETIKYCPNFDNYDLGGDAGKIFEDDDFVKGKCLTQHSFQSFKKTGDYNSKFQDCRRNNNSKQTCWQRMRKSWEGTRNKSDNFTSDQKCKVHQRFAPGSNGYCCNSNSSCNVLQLCLNNGVEANQTYFPDGRRDQCCQGDLMTAVTNNDRFNFCDRLGRKDHIKTEKNNFCSNCNNYKESNNRDMCLNTNADKRDNDENCCDNSKVFYSQERENICPKSDKKNKTNNRDKRDRKHCTECSVSNEERKYNNLGTNTKINNIDYSSIYIIKNCPDNNTHDRNNDFNGCKWNPNSQFRNPSQNIIDCRCTDTTDDDLIEKCQDQRNKFGLKHMIEYDFPYKTTDQKVNTFGYNFVERKIIIDDFINKIKQYEDKLADSIDKLKDLFKYDKNNSYEYKVKYVNNLILVDNKNKELINKLENELLLIKTNIKESDNRNSIIMKKKIEEVVKDDNNLRLLMTNNNELKIVKNNMENKLKENNRIKKYLSEELKILKKDKNVLNYIGDYNKNYNTIIDEEDRI